MVFQEVVRNYWAWQKWIAFSASLRDIATVLAVLYGAERYFLKFRWKDAAFCLFELSKQDKRGKYHIFAYFLECVKLTRNKISLESFYLTKSNN